MDLAHVLAGIYPQEEDARRVAQESGLSTSSIHFDGQSLNTWSSIVGVARNEQLLPNLLSVAFSEYPNNDDLRVALSRFLQPRRTELSGMSDSMSDMREILVGIRSELGNMRGDFSSFREESRDRLLRVELRVGTLEMAGIVLMIIMIIIGVIFTIRTF